MKSMTTKIPLFAVLMAFIFASCEDIIEVDLGEQNTEFYVVEAKITTEDNPYVYLYKSQSVSLDDPYRGIGGAKVVVADDAQPTNLVELTEHSSKTGFYTVPPEIDFMGKTGRKYTVIIEVDGVELTASDRIAEVEPIDFIEVKPSLRGDSIFLGIFTYGDEPVGLGDYYKWDIYINDTLLNDAQSLVIASDELVDGNYINGFEIFTDFHDPNTPEERKLQLGDSIQVKQNSISAFTYNYFFQMLNQSQTGGLFSVPPANIESNFTSSNGKPVLGLFTAQDVSVSNTVVIDENIESQLKD